MKATRALGWAVLGQLCFLAASGVYLFFNYRPSPSGAWFASPSGADGNVRAGQIVRGLHHLDSWLVLATALTLAVVVLVERRLRTWHTFNAWLVVGVCLVAAFTGYLLPWDQLALRAVTVGVNFTGYRPLLDDSARFVLIGHSEVDVSTIVRWLAVHVGLGVAAVGGIAAMLLKR